MPNPTVPEDPDAERLILGACLLEGNIQPLGELTENDFFTAKNRRIYSTLKALAGSGVPLNAVELSKELNKNGKAFEYALYVATLTDAVPIVHNLAEQLGTYQARLRQLADERAIRSAAAEVSREGASLDDIREKAAAIVEKAKPKEKSAAAGKNKYPVMPATAWHPAAELYRKAVADSTEASDNYHLACFLTVVGSLLGRTLYVRKGRVTYPNLFTVLVGKSGARKGTAMDLALDLLRAVDPRVYTLDAIDSKESCVKELADDQHDQRDSGDEQLMTEHRELLAMEEFGSLIEKAGQKGTRNIMPFLCKLYDCPPREANKAFASKAELKEPTMSVCSGTSESYLEPLTLRDIKGGVGNRVNWVGGDPKDRKPDPPDPNAEILNQLVLKIRDRVEKYRRMKRTRLYLSTAATKRFNEFYLKEYNPATGDELMEVLGERDAQTVIKVALIYAALDAREENIDLEHIEAGIAYASFLYSTRLPIFSGHGLSYAAAAQRRIVEIVQREGTIPLARLQPLMARHCDATLLEKYIRAMAFAGGPIKVETLGRKVLVMKGDI